MTYEEFRRDLTRYSNDEECILAISKEGKERYNFKVDDKGLYSSMWHNPLNEGFIDWKEIEELIDEDNWENYPRGKRTIMRMGSKEYIIEAYFLSDIN